LFSFGHSPSNHQRIKLIGSCKLVEGFQWSRSYHPLIISATEEMTLEKKLLVLISSLRYSDIEHARIGNYAHKYGVAAAEGITQES